MPSTLAILTSDPNLLRCQVAQLKEKLKPDQERPKAIGLGYFEADNILLRKKPGDVGTLDLSALVSDVISEVLFYHAGPPGTGAFADEDAMPLRFRRWMFMYQGTAGSSAAVRAALLRNVPEHLGRRAKGTAASEICFLAFVQMLSSQGHSDDIDVPPRHVGRALGQAARKMEAAELASDGKAKSASLFVTNGRILAATGLSSGALTYQLFEGIPRCPRCRIDERTPDSNPLVRAHRRARAVVLATGVADTAGFLEVPADSTITVGHDLQVQISPID